MSMSHVLRVMKEVHALPASSKLALAAIADDASDGSDLSWPGVEKVALWADTSQRQTLRIIAALEAGGWIEQTEKGYRGHRAVFRVTLDVGLERVSSTVETGDGKGDIQGQERVSSRVERVTSTVTKGDMAMSPLSPSPSNSPKDLSVRDEVEQAFDRIWAEWPRKDGKKVALQKFRLALKRADVATIGNAALIACRVWAAWPSADRQQFVPWLQTWLQQDRWNDPPPQPRSAGRGSVMDDAQAAADELRRRRESPPQKGLTA